MAEQGPIAITESPDFLVAEINGHPARYPLAGSVHGAKRTSLGEVAFTTVAAIDAAMTAGKRYRPGTLVIDIETNLVLGIINGDGILSSAGGGSATPLVGALTSNSTTSALRADQGPVLLTALGTKYTFPAGGVPESDLAAALQTKLNNPTVSAATTGARGTIRLAGDLGGTADTPTVPALAGKQATLTSVADVPGLVGALDAKLDAADMATINGQSITAGGNLAIASGLPVSSAWVTTWDATGNKDIGSFTVTGPLSLLGTTAGAIPGGRTQGVLVGNGAAVPTFSGIAASGYNTTGRTAIAFWAQGGSCFWQVGDSVIYVPATGPAIEITGDGGAVGSGLPTTAAWGTSWDTAAYKDRGTFTITGPLALTSDDTGSVVGGATQAVLIANGTNIPTFDGVAASPYTNTNGQAHFAALIRAGDRVMWSIQAVTTSHALVALSAPVNTAPTIIGTPTAGTAVAWTGQSVTGNPTPTTVFSWRTSGGVLVQDNITSGSYTPPAAGSFLLRMTSTNSQGTDTDDVAVTVAAALPVLSITGSATQTSQTGAALYSVNTDVARASAVTVALSADAGGNVSPTSISLPIGSAAVNFTYTADLVGARTLTASAAGHTSGSLVVTVAARAPGIPTLSSPTSITATGFSYTWADGQNGGSAITNRMVDYSFDGTTWLSTPAPSVGSNTITFASDPSARTAQIRGRATNAVGAGAYGTLTGIAAPAATSTFPAGIFPSSAGVTDNGAGSYTFTTATYKNTSAYSASGDFTLIVKGAANNSEAGVSATNAAASSADIKYGIYDGGSNWYIIVDGAGSPMDGSAAIYATTEANRAFKITRTGTAIKFFVSIDGGTTWVDDATYASHNGGAPQTATDTTGVRYITAKAGSAPDTFAFSGSGFV